MKIEVDKDTADALERERAARGLRSRTEANRAIVLEADKARINDPVWSAVLRAPVGPPETKEERALVAKVTRELAAKAKKKGRAK